MKDKKEAKTKKIDIRVTPTEKEKIVEYAKAHDMTTGEFIRKVVNQYFTLREEE